MYYQDDYCYYFRKPTGIPSTFGKEKSFLDYLLDDTANEITGKIHKKSGIIQSLSAFFGTEKELGLLNRLDNETSGLLYFAKNPRVYRDFKTLQSSFLLNKYYLAEVYGDFSHKETFQITLPITHHRFNPDRMVVIQHESDLKKAKGTLHHLTTSILEFQFLPTSNTSILLIKIQKGIRHQIRAHLASIGYPICGDKLYSKSDHKRYNTLQLFSVGLESVGEKK